jgi:hypothetical protein
MCAHTSVYVLQKATPGRSSRGPGGGGGGECHAGPTLRELLDMLDLYQVRYILTDGWLSFEYSLLFVLK